MGESFRDQELRLRAACVDPPEYDLESALLSDGNLEWFIVPNWAGMLATNILWGAALCESWRLGYDARMDVMLDRVGEWRPGCRRLAP